MSKIQRDILAMSQVANMAAEGRLNLEVDLYAFYGLDSTIASGNALLAQIDVLSQTEGGEGSPQLQTYIFTNELACYAEMVSIVRNGGAVSDVVRLLKTVKGPADLTVLSEEIEYCLQKECRRAFLVDGNKVSGAHRIALLDDDTFACDAQNGERDNVERGDDERDSGQSGPERSLSGFAWRNDSGALQVYSNAYLPRSWQKWRQEEKAGTAISPLVIKRVSQEVKRITADERCAFEEYAASFLTE